MFTLPGTNYLVERVKVVDPPMKGQTKSGYGGGVPTQYMVKVGRNWLRVLCMIYGNSGTLWVRFKSETFTICEQELQQLLLKSYS